MHFFMSCNRLEAVNATLKVWGKSLTAVLDKVHFVVNLYSSPLPLVPQANPSFSKVSYFPHPRQNNFQNFPLFLC